MLPITRASLQSFCRTCLKEFEKPSKKQLTQVYNVEKSETLRKWLATICEAIKFRGADDTFPRCLCHICYVKVRTFYEFRERALCSVEAVKELLAEDLEVTARKNLQMFCRTCLKKIKNTQNFTNILETPNVAQWLQQCIGLDVESEEFVEFPQLVCLWCFKKLRNYVEFCEISLQSLEYLKSVVGCGNSLELKTVDNPPCYEERIISPASDESERIVLSDLLAAIRKSEPVVEQSTNSKVTSPVREMIFVEKLPIFKADLYQEVIEMEESTNGQVDESSLKEEVNGVANGTKETTPTTAPIILRKSSRKRFIPNQTAQTLDELKAADHSPCNDETSDKEPSIFEDTSDYEPPTTKLKIKRKITTKIKSKKATHRSLEPKPASKKIQCHQCNRSFNKAINCQAHIRYDHEGFEKPFQCEICKVGFRVYFYLKRHMREQHAKPTADTPNSQIKITYECEICRKIFKRKDHLQDHHNQVHLGMRPFKCRTCEKTFGTRKTCRVHEMCHTGERPFGCDKCDKTFRQKCELRIHLEVHTENKELLCPICKRIKSSPEELAAHIEYHAATERHQCTKCGKIFKRSTHLSDHDKAVHLKLRPFKCSYCELSFALPKTCRTHERTHTGERPELCPLCDKSFKQRSVLMNHIKRYHPKEAQKAKK